MSEKQWSEWCWDAWCIVSCIGIWPRFIEPKLLTTKFLNLAIDRLPEGMKGLKILHFSDLHWSGQFSAILRKKIVRRINALTPDLILFTGDFLSRSQLENPEGLKFFLESLKARVGCFAVLGNHDYTDFVTVNSDGDYDIEEPSSESTIVKGFRRLFHSRALTKKATLRAQETKRHPALLELLKDSSFHVLMNETKQIAYKGHWINICGLEEYSMGKCRPDQAFKNFDPDHPGIVLAHNPDMLEILKEYPGDLVLCGHTHGGQVNLPWFWRRFTRLEHMEYKSGLKQVGRKRAYINRGISGLMKFRWFAPPELTLITLT